MIKTFDDLREWCFSVADGLGDPSAATGNAFFEFRRSRIGPPSDLLSCTFSDRQGLLLQLGPDQPESDLLPLSIKMGESEIGVDGVENYGMTPIIPGLWAIDPSLNVRGVLHVFVTVYGVPDPAPWEKRIVVAR